MRVNKKQIAVVTVLNIVIVFLVAAVFFIPRTEPTAAGDDTGVTGPPTVHEKLRDAEKGKVAGIETETRLMGAGEESAVFVAEISGVTYVFGNTTASGLDFDGYGGFLCRLNGAGKILGFTYFDGRMTAAGIAEGGFLVGTTETENEKETARLYSVGLDGEKTETARTDGAAADIISVGGGKVAVVTRPYGALKLTEYILDGGKWTAGRNTRITSGLDTEYFDCYYVGGGYVIAARACDPPRYDSLVFYTFEAGGNAAPHYFGGKDENALTPFDVMPYEGGYLALCRLNGVAAVASVDYTFTSFRRDSLGFSLDGAKLLYADKKYYACFDRSQGPITYEINKTLDRSAVVEAYGMLPSRAASFGGKTVFTANDDDSVTVFALGGGKRVFPLNNAKVYRMLCGEEGITIVLSASGGDAVTKPVGPSDLYVLHVKYPD